MKETEEEVKEFEEWKEVESDSKGYVSWNEETIEKPVKGKLEGFEIGAQGGQIAILTDEKGEKFKCSASTILFDKLKDQEGSEVMIKYLGEKKSKSGRMFKDFKVFVKTKGKEEQRGKGAQAPSPSKEDRVEAFLDG